MAYWFEKKRFNIWFLITDGLEFVWVKPMIYSMWLDIGTQEMVRNLQTYQTLRIEIIRSVFLLKALHRQGR